MGLLQTKTIEMAAMAVLNHTDEELDDDLVSNLSLNLMVSDNEDGGSPSSDQFDKLDSRNESPEDSNNCDISEETNINCAVSNNEMKDDLQQLRDITGDSSWSAVDDVDCNEYAVDKEILTETDNKDIHPSIVAELNEDEDKIMKEDDVEDDTKKENCDPFTEEANDNKEAIATQDANEMKSLENNSCLINSVEESKEKDEEMENEEDANEMKSLENDSCLINSEEESKEKDEEMENEERLLNDVRDAEKDSYDCEHFDEDALLSDPRDEDLLQITEEKSTEIDTADFLKSCQEDQDANENSSSSMEKTEDNQSESAGEYEESNNDLQETEIELENNDIDNDTNDTYDLNLIKNEDDTREECNAESNNMNDDVHMTENEDSSLHSENNIDEPETLSVESFNTSPDIHKEAILEESEEATEALTNGAIDSDDIEHSTDTTSHEAIVEASNCITEQSINTNEVNEFTENDQEQTLSIALGTSIEMDAVSDKYCEDESLLSETQAITKKIIITNVISCGDEAPIVTSEDTEQSTEVEETTEHEEIETLSENETVEESMKSNTISEPTTNDVTSEGEVLPIPPEESDVPLDRGTDDCPIEQDETEQRIQIQTIHATVNNQLHSNDAVMDDNGKISVEELTNDIDDSKETDPTFAVTEVVENLIEPDGEPMDVDDMELDAEPLENNFVCLNKDAVIIDSPDEDRTNKPETITSNDTCTEGKTDTSTVNQKDDFITDVDLIPDRTKPESTSTNRLDENIINLTDDSDPEVIADSGLTDISKLSNQVTESAVKTIIESTAEISECEEAANASTISMSCGIEGDNKECEDMDIEEIIPYKESARPNGSVLKQILVGKNIPGSLPSTLPLVSLPLADRNQNAKRISNTIADNNIGVVSPQPGEKRLSSDNFQSESAKRRRLATPAARENRQKYLESFKQAMTAANWSRIGRRQLEEFVAQKILETIHYKTEMGQLQKKCLEYKQSLENLRTNSLTLTKQLRDMNSVHIKLEREINLLKLRNRDEDKPLVAVKITRSVGLQAIVDDPKVTRRGRSINNAGPARTNVQKQPAQIAHQQQQQVQQKPMNQQQQSPQVQQRVVVVGAGASPQMAQLQSRPTRPMVSVPSVSSPVQTRTMSSRNKKVPISTVVTNTNPPPLRSINQQQQSPSIPNSSAVNIPMKHVTGPTILNKGVTVPMQSISAPIVTTPTKETTKGVIDLTDEDDVGKKLSPAKVPPQQQQRITLMSTVVNGQQVLLRVVSPIHPSLPPFIPTSSLMSYPTVYRQIHPAASALHHMNPAHVFTDGGGPIPTKTAAVLSNYVQSSPALLQRAAATNAVKVMASVPHRTRTSSGASPAAQQQPNNSQPPATSPNNTRRFRHPAPLPAPPASQNLIKGNKPIPPKPSVTVTKSPNGSGIIVKWNMPSMLSLFEKIVRYELFVYQVTKSPPRTDSWGKINDVGALDLPMAVSLTEFAEGNRYYFAVRAVDELGRLGPFSEPQTIVF